VQGEPSPYVITTSKLIGKQVAGAIKCITHNDEHLGIIHGPDAARWDHFALPVLCPAAEQKIFLHQMVTMRRYSRPDFEVSSTWDCPVCVGSIHYSTANNLEFLANRIQIFLTFQPVAGLPANIEGDGMG
jgi:hypothetical protein